MPNAKKNSLSSFVKRVGYLFAALWLAAFCWSPHLLAADTNVNVNVKVCYPTPHPPPTIASPSDGTTTEDSSILLTGEATPNVPVYAYRNDSQVGFVTTGSDGIYAISISLVMGSNALKASTNNDCHTPSFSSTVTVERQVVEPPPSPGPEPTPETPSEPSEEPSQTDEQQPPDADAPGDQPERKKSPREQPPGKARAPIILQPQDGTVVHEPFVLVVGEASPLTEIQILRGGHAMAGVLSDDEGRFMARIPLKEGANHLVAAVGELFSETVIVTYEPSQPAINSWFVRGILLVVGLGLGLLVFTLVWQPAFARRIWRILRWRKVPK